MGKVRIVGGGLTGVLAAFEAHRLGARDVELCERFDELGGELAPRSAHGLELRDRCFYFGGHDDEVRRALEWAGVAFHDFEARCGSAVASAPGRPASAVEGPGLSLTLPPHDDAGRRPESLADRLRGLPGELQAPLARYCQWRLGVWLDEVHERAAAPLGLVANDRRSGRYASLPRDGFIELFRTCARRLESLGVEVRCNHLVSPQEVLASRNSCDMTVWAADPTPWFSALDLPAPKRVAPPTAVYVFKTRHAGPTPFYVQNFTAKGAVFRIYLYECRGETLASVECVAETPDEPLRREVYSLMAGFGEEALVLGDCLSADVRAAAGYPSVEARRSLDVLRLRLAQRLGGRFVAGAWDADDPASSLCEVRRALAAALTPEPLAQASAA